LEELPKPKTHTERALKVTEHAFELLARSDQWVNFIGDEEETKDIDDLIRAGDLHDAQGRLVWVFLDAPIDDLMQVAVESRARFLEDKSVVDETPATRINKILDQLGEWETSLTLLRMELPHEDWSRDESLKEITDQMKSFKEEVK